MIESPIQAKAFVLQRKAWVSERSLAADNKSKSVLSYVSECIINRTQASWRSRLCLNIQFFNASKLEN